MNRRELLVLAVAVPFSASIDPVADEVGFKVKISSDVVQEFGKTLVKTECLEKSLAAIRHDFHGMEIMEIAGQSIFPSYDDGKSTTKEAIVYVLPKHRKPGHPLRYIEVFSWSKV